MLHIFLFPATIAVILRKHGAEMAAKIRSLPLVGVPFCAVLVYFL